MPLPIGYDDFSAIIYPYRRELMSIKKELGIMSEILAISVPTNNFKNHVDIFSCYINSADALHAIFYDALLSGNGGDISKRHIITSVYLYRHSIELAIKALIKELKNEEVYGHNIKKLWEDYILDNPQGILPDEIKKAFDVLEKYGVLENEELFRYPQSKNGVTLENILSIEITDLGILHAAAYSIRHLVLVSIHQKKGLPPTDYM